MKNDTERLSGMYTRAFILLGGEPETASPRKKRRVRKRLNREDRELRAQPLLPELDDDAFFRALREADRRLDREAEKHLRAMNDLLSEFSPKIQEALSRLLDGTILSYLIRNGQEAEIRVLYGAFRCRLLLQDAEGSLPDGRPFYSLSLHREGKRFRVDCADGSEEGEPEEPFALTFAGIETVIEPFDCSQPEVCQDIPWQVLFHAATVLREKAESAFAEDACNPEELALLPLLDEVFRLFLSECGAYPLLRELATSYRLFSMEKLLNALETCNAKRARRYARKITSLFCDRSSEPLWRELYGRIRASQAGYPPLAEMECPADALASVRKQVQTLMEANGYEGAYPDFVKTGKISGLRMARSYGKDYLIALEKQVVFRVHLTETAYTPETLHLQTLSGTALLKTGEAAEDIYACLFRANGRRIFRAESFSLSPEEPDAEELALRLGVAVKRAELRRLTKEERKRVSTKPPFSGLWTFLFFLLFGGGLFSLLLNTGMLLLAIAVFLLAGQPEVIPSFFLEFPWWKTVVFAWVGFGGLMGLITAWGEWKER